MTVRDMKNAAISAVAVAALAWAGSVQAASDYLLKFEGVPGESNILTGPGAGPHVKASGHKIAAGGGKAQGQTAHKGHEKWIELMSMQLGAERTATDEMPASTVDHGVKSPRDAASGLATGKRAHKPVRTNREASAPSISEKSLSAGDTEMAGLLLPAVQKVREAAARMAPWTGCAAGQKIEAIAIKQISTGKEGRILDPVVTSCATESISFNFTKIEWK